MYDYWCNRQHPRPPDSQLFYAFCRRPQCSATSLWEHPQSSRWNACVNYSFFSIRRKTQFEKSSTWLNKKDVLDCNSCLCCVFLPRVTTSTAPRTAMVLFMPRRQFARWNAVVYFHCKTQCLVLLPRLRTIQIERITLLGEWPISNHLLKQSVSQFSWERQWTAAGEPDSLLCRKRTECTGGASSLIMLIRTGALWMHWRTIREPWTIFRALNWQRSMLNSSSVKNIKNMSNYVSAIKWWNF